MVELCQDVIRSVLSYALADIDQLDLIPWLAECCVVNRDWYAPASELLVGPPMPPCYELGD